MPQLKDSFDPELHASAKAADWEFVTGGKAWRKPQGENPFGLGLRHRQAITHWMLSGFQDPGLPGVSSPCTAQFKNQMTLHPEGLTGHDWQTRNLEDPQCMSRLASVGCAISSRLLRAALRRSQSSGHCRRLPQKGDKMLGALAAPSL